MPDNDTPEKPLTTMEWFITMLILAIPVVGIIMHFVWAFSDGGNLGRRNFCRAALLWVALGITLAGLFVVAMLVYGGGLAMFANQMQKVR